MSTHWRMIIWRRSDVEPVEGPGQAWNAVTVGGYTDLDTSAPDEAGFDGWTPIADHGDLSPHSTVTCHPTAGHP
jgi:hypothetical protein